MLHKHQHMQAGTVKQRLTDAERISVTGLQRATVTHRLSSRREARVL